MSWGSLAGPSQREQQVREQVSRMLEALVYRVFMENPDDDLSEAYIRGSIESVGCAIVFLYKLDILPSDFIESSRIRDLGYKSARWGRDVDGMRDPFNRAVDATVMEVLAHWPKETSS